MKRTREQIIEQRLQRCAHFNGTSFDDDQKRCEAGVIYRDLIGHGRGSLLRLPCLKGKPDAAECARREWTTQQQAEAAADEFERHMELFVPALAAAKEHAGNKAPCQGSTECPCGKGRVSYSVASNGHMWASCSCGEVRFME